MKFIKFIKAVIRSLQLFTKGRRYLKNARIEAVKLNKQVHGVINTKSYLWKLTILIFTFQIELITEIKYVEKKI